MNEEAFINTVIRWLRLQIPFMLIHVCTRTRRYLKRNVLILWNSTQIYVELRVLDALYYVLNLIDLSSVIGASSVDETLLAYKRISLVFLWAYSWMSCRRCEVYVKERATLYRSYWNEGKKCILAMIELEFKNVCLLQRRRTDDNPTSDWLICKTLL